MLDSVQIGWSTTLYSVLDHFISSMLKTRTNRADSGASAYSFQNQLSGTSEAPTEKETKVLNFVPSHNPLDSGSVDFTESSELCKQLLFLLKNADSNVQFTNINVYMCHEQAGKITITYIICCMRFIYKFPLLPVINRQPTVLIVGAMVRLDVLTFRQRPTDLSLSCEGVKINQFPIHGKVRCMTSAALDFVNSTYFKIT